jgi:hypothetical protein
MDDNRMFGRFLAWMLAALSACCLLVVAVVVVIDPYRLYQVVRLPGFNALRPALEHDQEEIKLTLARKAGANAVVMGNSRAELGLDPAGMRDGADTVVPYNLAISGSSISTSRSELSYLHSVGATPRRIILGVEFLDFMVNGTAQPAAAQPPSSPVNVKNGYPVDRFKWKFDTLFSLTSLGDSVTTLRVQQGQEVPIITPDGFNPMRDYARYAREEGYYAIFRQRAEEYAGTFVGKPHDLVLARTGSSPAIDDLQAMIALAGKQGVTLQLMIYPYHAQMLAMFEQAGLWPVFEAWKQMLAQQVAKAQRDYPGMRIELWDFSGFSAMQCEPIPARDDKRTSTRWYWEAGHFKKSLGDLMMARMQDGAAPAAAPSGTLGFRLTLDTLAENRARIARERSRCQAEAPATFAEADALVARARKLRSLRS